MSTLIFIHSGDTGGYFKKMIYIVFAAWEILCFTTLA